MFKPCFIVGFGIGGIIKEWRAKCLLIFYLLGASADAYCHACLFSHKIPFVRLDFLLFIQNKFIPNTAIYHEQSKPGLFKRVWPNMLSWVIAASRSVVAAYIFSVLKSGGSLQSKAKRPLKRRLLAPLCAVMAADLSN
jgi:hypothetical protein